MHDSGIEDTMTEFDFSIALYAVIHGVEDG